MASNNATFHAKITADASDFVKQVESANEALTGLVGAYGKAGKASKGNPGKSASKAQKDTGKEAKAVWDKAQSAADDYYANIVQEERKVAAVQKKAADAAATGGRGKAGEFVQGYKSGGDGADREAIQQRMLYDKLGKEMLRKDREHDQNLKQIARTHETIGEKIYENWVAKNRIRAVDKAELGDIKKRLLQQDKMNKLQDEAQRENSRRGAIENRKQLDAMVTGRYALYDMANAYQSIFRVAARVTGELIKTVNVASQFESAFTSVERALELDSGSAGFNEIRQVLIDLSREIPVAFDELSEIATLGAQMGITAENIEAFTRTISSFTATTGVSIDDAAEKFGRIASLLNVPVQDFENLGSAVLFAGYNAVATEAEILAMTQSIAASAATVGMAADETVGLSTALASLGLAPELSRGSLQRIFAEINRAVAGTSPYMDEFARALNMAEEEAAFLWKEDPSYFFNSLLSSLGGVEDLTSALDSLGIINIRDVELITRLSKNYDVYTKSMDDATDSYAKGTALADNYAKVADNLESKLTILVNSFTALQAALAAPTGEVLKPLIDGLNEAIKAVTKFANTGVGGFILPLTVAVGGAVLAFAGLNFVLNIGQAQVLAMRTATLKMAQIQELGGQTTNSMRSRIAELTNQILGNTYAIVQNSGATVFWTKNQIQAEMTAGRLEVATGKAGLAAGKATFAVRGLSVALRVMTALTAVGFIVTLGSMFVGAGQKVGYFRGAINRTEDDLRLLGEKAISASGGLQALMDTAAVAGADSEYKQFTQTLDELTLKQRQLANDLEKVADAAGSVKREFSDIDAVQDSYGNSIEETTDALAEQLRLSKDSGTVIIDALAATTYEKDGEMTSYFLEQIRNPEITRAAELLGFDITDAVSASMLEGGTANAYYAQYEDAFKRIAALANSSSIANLDQGEISFNPLTYGVQEGTAAQEAFAGLEDSGDLARDSIDAVAESLGITSEAVETVYAMVENNPDINFDFLRNGIDLIDGYLISAREAFQANQAVLDAGGTGAAEEGVKSMTEAMKDYLTQTNLVTTTAQNSKQAFQSLADGIIGTTGSLEDLDNTSKTNLENFESYVISAFAAAEVSGRGAEGAMEDIALSIITLGKAGVNTAGMIKQFESIAITSLGSVGASYAQMLTDVAAAPDLEGMKKIIIAFYRLKIAAAQSKEAAFGFISDMNRALRGLSDSSFDITGPVTQSMTALEKLTESLDSLFSWTGQQTGISSSLRTLGKSLEENGNTFSIWSEAGESNVNNIEGVIRQLATRSGGNLQTFANLLASLRQSLVDAGVGASGLRYVDIAIENTGKTGKATDSIVKRLTNSLEDIDSSVDEIKTVEEAIKAVADAASKGIKSNFSEAYAIDEVTLGWLDMADAAEDAAESIVNFQEDIDKANESIEDATQSIIEAKAAIDGLTADRGKLEYQLEVALRYGDFLRADQIRADIAKVDADLLGEADNISDANKDISKSQKDMADAEQGIIDVRTESTREAIEASRALEDMAEKYALVTAGMIINADEGEDLIAIIDAQVEAFKENAIQMGYTETKAQAVADVLRKELIKSMDEIPENIETDIVADTDEALSNVLSFVSKANTALALIKDRTVTTTFVEKRVGYKTSSNPTHWDGHADGGIVRGAGTGTSDSIAARLSNGEFVVNASAVQHFGVPFMNALNQSKLPAASMSAPSQQGQGSQMVYLSPEDRQLLRSAVERPISLYTDNTVIAKSANAGNQVLAQRGSN